MRGTIAGACPTPTSTGPTCRACSRRKASRSPNSSAPTGARTFKYLYDFGDGWEHKLRIEKTGEPAPGATCPRLIDASGRCPPEDVGGPWGYAEYLEVMASPDHHRHAEVVVRRGPDFDPNVVDVAGIDKELAKLAKRCSRSKSKRRRKAA